MEIYGREVGFLRTVESNCRILEKYPDDKFSEIFTSDDYVGSQKSAAEIMQILSESYEKRKRFEDPEYQMRPLTAEEALSLTDEEFSEAFNEALTAFSGEKPTIETETPEDAKKNEESVSS